MRTPTSPIARHLPQRTRAAAPFVVALLFVALGIGVPLSGVHTNVHPVPAAGVQLAVPVGLSASLQAAPSTVAVGQSVQLWANASGGVTPYSYLYRNLPSGCFTANLSTLTCSPTSAGAYSTVNVTVTDPANQSAIAAVSIEVVPALTLDSSTATPTSVQVGGSFTYTISVSNGVPPYRAQLSGFPSGCSAPGPTSSTTISIPCTVGSAGTYSVSASVGDSDRESVSGNSFTISASSNNNNNGNGNSNNNHSGNNSNSSFNFGGLIPSWFFLALVAFGLLGLAGFVAIILTAVFTGLTASRTKKMVKLLQAGGVPAASAPAVGGTACAACGRTNPGDAKFCLGCGKPLDAK